MKSSKIEEIRKLADKGLYLTQIARILSIDLGTLRYQCKRHNITIKTNGVHKIDSSTGNTVIDLASKGHTIPEISVITGIHKSTLFHWLHRNNIKVSNGKGMQITPEQDKMIRHLAQEGYYQKAIAKKLNLDRSTIKLFCHRYSIRITQYQKQKLSHDELTSRLPKNIDLTGNKKSGKYEIYCKIHDFRKFRSAMSLTQGCPKCSNYGFSKEEQSITNILKNLNIITSKYKFSSTSPGSKSEIDIFSVDKKIGIEYCGLYWHNEKSPEPRNKQYHYNKMKLAENDGIRLITIFSDEWKNRQKQVLNFLQATFGIFKVTIHGRHTAIKIIDKKIGTTFLDDNHIQGAARTSLVYFGLFDGTDLVGVMSLGRHHRGTNSNIAVLDRLCFSDGVLVHGGASKLLKHATDWAKSNGYSKIISWSDNRWSQGNVYKKMGFTLEEELPPDYSYVIQKQRLSKQSCQKKHLIKKGAVGNTEKEMATSLGYKRIWDCGKKRWALNL